MSNLPSPSQRNVRLSLPSKGVLSESAVAFLQECGLTIHKPNPRQYQATIREIPGLDIFFQRPIDIVNAVRDGSMDFGISGLDVIEEFKGDENQVLILHDALGFGGCRLQLAVPEGWEDVPSTVELSGKAVRLGRPLRIVTKFPTLTGRFLASLRIEADLITTEGTLETAPAIGYADMISDLVSSGQTLKDNRLRALPDGIILRSQASLIGNITALQKNPEAQRVARILLEYIEANLRGKDNVSVFANMRGESPEAIARKLFENDVINGLQGPTISPVFVEDSSSGWFAVNVVVRRTELFQAVNALREVGGSGVVVLPVMFIFEEEPPRYTAMIKAIQKEN
ncbi:MAG: ATP phosphoribosyltransferase [Anaerolineae bacterium]|nr:ATP phosphoribosyltransferase [Anaerolineae bacterium]